MRHAAVLFLMVLAAGCATAPAAPTVAGQCDPTSGGPAWLLTPAKAFGGDSGKAMYGVGSISNIIDFSMRRDGAAQAARTAIAQQMKSFNSKLQTIYKESTSATTKEGTSPQEDQRMEQILKEFTSQQLQGVEIAEYYPSKCDNTMFALAKLDFNQFKDALQQTKELSDRMRDVIKAHADEALDNLSKEEAAHPAGN